MPITASDSVIKPSSKSSLTTSTSAVAPSRDWRLSAEMPIPITRPIPAAAFIDPVRAAQDLEYELSLQEDLRRIQEEEDCEEARLALLARILPEPEVSTSQILSSVSICYYVIFIFTSLCLDA